MNDSFDTIPMIDVNTLDRASLIETVKEHPQCIKYLDIQDTEICKVALEANYRVLCLIRNQNEELCMFAVQQSYLALAYVREQTASIIDEALKQNKYAIYYVDGSFSEYVTENYKDK